MAIPVSKVKLSDGKKVNPRRKFNVIRESIRTTLRSIERHEGWHFVPVRNCLEYIEADVSTSNLLFAGGKLENFPFINVREICEHFKSLPPPWEYVNNVVPRSYKLKQTPVFYPHARVDVSTMKIPSNGDSLWDERNLQEMYLSYERAEALHKQEEDHHPDGRFTGSTRKTLECVFDVYHSLLRQYSVAEAFKKLLEILPSAKFEKLDMHGVYASFIHFYVRGVFAGETLERSQWRKEHSQQALLDIHHLILRGQCPVMLASGYWCETVDHARALESELIRLRIGTFHDRSKFTTLQFWPYVWRWGVYEQLTPENRYKLHTQAEFYIGKETMMTLGKSFGDGVSVSAAPEMLRDAVASGIKNATQEITPQLQEAFHEEAKQVLEETSKLLSKTTEETSSVLQENVGKMETLIGKLTSSLDSVMSSFESIKVFLSSSFSKISDSIRAIPGMESIHLSLDSILMSIRDYILYVNVESIPLKAILVMSIFRNLGLLDVGYKYFLGILDYFRGSDDTPGIGQETAGPWEFIANSWTKIMIALSGVFASLCKGSLISGTQFWDLFKKLSAYLKEIHFIGAGCLGLTRIYDFVRKVYSVVSEWILKNIFGRVPEQEQLARKIGCWTVKVKYFSTEAGLTAIRLNSNMRDKAAKLYAEYLALSVQCRTKDIFRPALVEVERFRNDVRKIYDYIVRIEAVSNFVPTMFHFQFVGKAGVGKSTLTEDFSRHIQSRLWPEETKPSVYTYNPNLEYYDGYTGQKIFMIDDCFRYNEPKHMTNLIGLITNVPVILPMAHLEDKGIQLTSEVMISSTNVPWPIAKDVFCMEAVHRRRHMLVNVEMDPRVRSKSEGKFSKELFCKYYDEKDLPRNPHLKFTLLKPIPSNDGMDVATLSTLQFDSLQKYAKKLSVENDKVMLEQDSKFDPMCYFSDSDRPPEPLEYPCENWTYDQLIANTLVRLHQFRASERSFSTKKRYATAERAIQEVEMLFNQQEDISIPEAKEIGFDEFGKPMRLIEKWFSNVSEPYGISDEVGEKILEAEAEGIDTLAPELDTLDLDSEIESIVGGGKETSLVTTSAILAKGLAAKTTEEFKQRSWTPIEDDLRIARALRERNSRLRSRDPVIVKERLQQWYIDLDGHKRTVLRLNPHPTRWEEIQLDSPFRWTSPESQSWTDNLWGLHRTLTKQHGAGLPGNDHRIPVTLQTEALNFICSSLAYYPKNKEFGSLAGTKTTIPLYFLQNLHYIQNGWVLDVDKINRIFFSEHQEKTVACKYAGKEYQVPYDIAFLFSLSDVIRMYMLDFCSLTPEQQSLLVEDSKWRNRWTGIYTLKSVRESCTNIFKKMSLGSMEFLMSPLHFIFHKLPSVAIAAVSVAAFSGAIWLLRSMANLIFGNERETSKVLHRGPQSSIIYQGRMTAQREEEFFTTIMERHVRRLIIRDENYTKVEVQAIHHSKFLVFPKHALRALHGDLVLSLGIPGTNEFLAYQVPRSYFVISKDSDLCVVTHREFPQVRSIHKHLMTEKEYQESEFSGYFTFMGRYKNIATLDSHEYLRKSYKPTIRGDDEGVVYIDRALIVSGNSNIGKSGSVVAHISSQNIARVLGIQVWTLGLVVSPEIAVQVVTQEILSELERRATLVAQDLVFRLAEPELPRPETLDGVFTSFEVNNVIGEVPAEQLLGKVGKSQFKVTPIAKYMENDGYGSQRTPAALSGKDPRLQHPDHPLKHSVHKYVRGTVTEFSSEIEMAKDALCEWTEERLDTEDFSELNYNEIITGTREDGSNPMNLNSSPGIPFIHHKKSKGKRDYFTVDEEGMVDFSDPQIEVEFEKFYATLASGVLPLTMAYDFPKDELRPIDKVCGTSTSPPKTRTVTCMNMFYTMAWRKATLKFWNSMHRAADGTFPFCPGINPEGPDWSHAFHYLNRFPNAVDFDVTNWDGLVTAALLMHLADVICKAAKFPENQRWVVYSILTEVFNSYVQLGRTVYQKMRGMVSGFPGTAETNTFGHFLLLLYFWMRLVPKRYRTLSAFRRHVSFLVYGDDIVITFSDEIMEWFNGETIQNEYGKLGYPVTDGNKNAKVSKSKKLSEATFLKSSWSRCFYDEYVRRMDMSVAYDLLYWVRAKSDPLDQFCSNAIDSLRIAFGHGRKEYEAFQAKLRTWLKNAGIDLPLYTYRELLDDHVTRYYDMPHLPTF